MTKRCKLTGRYQIEFVLANGTRYTVEASRELTDVELTHLWNVIYDTPLPDHPASPWWVSISFFDGHFECKTLRLYGITPAQAVLFAKLCEPDWATWVEIGDDGGTIIARSLDRRPKPDRLSQELAAGPGV